MKEIYVVTSGDYPNFRVNATFDSIELARKYRKAFKNESQIDIDRFELNPYKDELQKDHKPYEITMNKNGDIDYIECTLCDIATDFNIPFAVFAPNLNQFNYQKRLKYYCFAKNDEHAIKLAKEKRLELIENNLWK